MKLLPPLMLAVFTIGCSTQPLATDQSRPIESKEISSPELFKESPGTVKLVIKRDEGFLGGGITAHLHLDGKEFAVVEQGEKAVIFVKPGTHIISVTGWSWTPFEVEAHVSADDPPVYRISIGEQGGPTISRTAF